MENTSGWGSGEHCGHTSSLFDQARRVEQLDENGVMSHPVQKLTIDVAQRNGWDVKNYGEAKVALELRRLGYRPDDVATQFRLGPYKLDFALVAERIDIEADGWVHTARDVRRRDAVRDRRLREWGWTVIRIDVDDDLAEQIARRVPSRVHLPEFDATMRQVWAIFSVAVDRLTRRSAITDPAVRVMRIRDALKTALDDPGFLPARKPDS